MFAGLDNPTHLLLILVVVLLVFGAKRLPEIGKNLGTGMRGFKDGLMTITEHEEDTKSATPDYQAALAAAPPDPVDTAASQPDPVMSEPASSAELSVPGNGR